MFDSMLQVSTTVEKMWQNVRCREAYNMFACNGILFNHESPRRGEHFVTRKITTGAVRVHLQQDDYIELGNLDAQRDPSHVGHPMDIVSSE